MSNTHKEAPDDGFLCLVLCLERSVATQRWRRERTRTKQNGGMQQWFGVGGGSLGEAVSKKPRW